MSDLETTDRRNTSALARSWSAGLPVNERSGMAPDWLGAVRARAAGTFREHGLPGNKDEPWKYTSLRRLEALAPVLHEGGDEGADGPVRWTAPLSDVGGFGFRWIDGRIEWLDGQIPDGVQLRSLDEVLRDGEHGLGARLRQLVESVEITGRSRAFEALNTALLGPGVVIHVKSCVAAGRCQAQWVLPARKDSGLHNLRVILLLDAGASIQFLEQYGPATLEQDGAAETTAQALNLLLQADLAQNATMEHVRLQCEADDAVLLTFADIHQADSSRYRYSGFDLGGGLVRHALSSRLEGPGAEAVVQGAFVGDGDRHVDYHVAVEHCAPGCTSDQFFRGVLGGRSRGVFNGKAIIRPGADGSSVQQSNANLLLSREAEMDTKPELEIYADEVEARHGATVGQLDDVAVFYLRTRGLTEGAARRMLTTAFCRAVADRLGDRELSEPIAELLEAAMPAQESEPRPRFAPGLEM